MDLCQLTRALIDIESITGNEQAVAGFLAGELAALAARTGGQLEKMSIEPGRFNVFASWGSPVVTLSTHMDTVPPYIPSSEDDSRIWGRGACDAKGIIASMIHAAMGLLESGKRSFGLLFVAGEERNSAGARAAALRSRGSRYLINGEPTGNKLAVGSKGALRFEISATGKMAHSAYPEFGESAIDKLLDTLEEIRRAPLPEHPVLGRSTLNIGTISGGRAPNVVPDAAATEIMFRLVGDAAPLREAVNRAAAGRATAREVLCIPAVELGAIEGMETTVVAYTSDIPEFGAAWGKPYMLGPGFIRQAHSLDEHVQKQQLIDAVRIYQTMVSSLLTQ
jgi:acetylornithine deacetylase